MGWLLLVCCHLARAENLDQTFATRLARARAGQVARLRADYEELRELRLACKLELREGRFPLACFRAFRREVDWRLHPASRATRLLDRLDAKCARATSRLRLPADGADLTPLSAACAARVSEGRKIRAYRNEETEDGDLWSGS